MRVEKPRADLLGKQWRDLPTEERGDLLGFNAQHGLADELFIEWAERGGGAERRGRWRIPPASGSSGRTGPERVETPGSTARHSDHSARCSWSGERESASSCARAQSSIRTKALSAMV